MKNTLISVLIFLSTNTFAQKKCLCDSLFNISKLVAEWKCPISIESPPEPFNRKEKVGDFVIKIKKEEYPVSKYYSSYLRHIVDVDSTVKCVQIMKGGNSELDSIAVEYLKTIRFVPAKQRGKAVPYFTYSRVTFIVE